MGREYFSKHDLLTLRLMIVLCDLKLAPSTIIEYNIFQYTYPSLQVISLKDFEIHIANYEKIFFNQPLLHQ